MKIILIKIFILVFFEFPKMLALNKSYPEHTKYYATILNDRNLSVLKI